MRNHLVEEVLDTAYQSALGSNGCKVAKFIANFKDPRPLTQKDDQRIIANREVSTWFRNWESQASTCENSKKRLFSSECREDIYSCISGFGSLVMDQLTSYPNMSIYPSHINSDPVENHFCQQRRVCNGNMTNPTYATYQKSSNSIILGQTSVSKKSNAGGKTGAISFAFERPGPVKKQKKSSSGRLALKEIQNHM